jgi:hypothetical protein
MCEWNEIEISKIYIIYGIFSPNKTVLQRLWRFWLHRQIVILKTKYSTFFSRLLKSDPILNTLSCRCRWQGIEYGVWFSSDCTFLVKWVCMIWYEGKEKKKQFVFLSVVSKTNVNNYIIFFFTVNQTNDERTLCERRTNALWTLNERWTNALWTANERFVNGERTLCSLGSVGPVKQILLAGLILGMTISNVAVIIHVIYYNYFLFIQNYKILFPYIREKSETFRTQRSFSVHRLHCVHLKRSFIVHKTLIHRSQSVRSPFVW